jgi:DNA transformation protein and related proteins
MSEFIEYLHEVFELFGPVSARKMFGGYGLYHQGLMFALIADEAIFLKTDGENLHYFENEGLDPFEYRKNGKLMKMTYYLSPDVILDDREAAALWARRSFDAALRAVATRKIPLKTKSAKKIRT